MLQVVLVILAAITFIATFSTKEGNKIFASLTSVLFTLAVILELFKY